MSEIRKIRAIDNHSHPPRIVADGERDDEFDALPCDPLQPTEPNTVTRPENPQYIAAWKALWGYAYDDRSDAHVKEMLAAKNKIRQEQGDNYPAWVLDRLGIDVEFANRVAMGRGLDAAHYRWVPFDDTLLFPLNNDALAAETPDRKFFFSRENMLLARYRRELGVASIPATLAECTSQVVTPELERQKKASAVAIKFEAAYLRSLDFEPASEQDAAAIYAKYARGGHPARDEYTRLQDYLFRNVAAEAGRLGLPVHIHTGAGCGGYFYLKGSNPLLLESVLNDERLRRAFFARSFFSSDEAERVHRFIRADLAGNASPSCGSPARLDRMVSGENIIWHRFISRKRRIRLGRGRLANVANGAASAGNRADRNAPGWRDYAPSRE
jgi:hypothetical protein